jgi:pimeloyl-ACP methyl ester carboxylesterase
VLAEWDPHPFGVMHEHIPLRAVTDITVPLTWILGQESSPWMAGLHDRVARQRPDIHTVRIAGAGHLVHLDRPADFITAVREAAAAEPGRDTPASEVSTVSAEAAPEADSQRDSPSPPA